jgi:hypothetical protein
MVRTPDLDDVLKPVARWWVGLLSRHRVVVLLIDLGCYALLISPAWILVGSTAGLIVLAATLGLYGYGIVRAWRHWRRTRA